MLNTTVELDEPATPTKDAYGGFSDTVQTTAYPASVQVDSSRNALEYERETKKRMFNVYLEASSEFKIGTRVTVTGAPYTGVRMSVVTAKADHAGRSTYWMLSCTETT